MFVISHHTKICFLESFKAHIKTAKNITQMWKIDIEGKTKSAYHQLQIIG